MKNKAPKLFRKLEQDYKFQYLLSGNKRIHYADELVIICAWDISCRGLGFTKLLLTCLNLRHKDFVKKVYIKKIGNM